MHKTCQCLVQLCKVVASKNTWIVSIEEIKHWLYLWFNEHKCGIFAIRLEKKLEDELSKGLMNECVITCLFNGTYCKAAVYFFFPPQESGLCAFLSRLSWNSLWRLNSWLKFLYRLENCNSRKLLCYPVYTEFWNSWCRDVIVLLSCPVTIPQCPKGACGFYTLYIQLRNCCLEGKLYSSLRWVCWFGGTVWSLTFASANTLFLHLFF